ncbi:MAG: molybdenum cofactor guanylyltransferase [Bacteroidales bacterium]
MEDLTGIILCGGKSSRMGTNKALLKLDNLTFTERIAERLGEFCSEIILSVNSNDFDSLPFRKVMDKFSGIGPMAGIVSSLEESKSANNFIISCDLPFISSEIISFLLNHKSAADIVAPVFKQKIQPLCSVIHKKVLPKFIAQISMKNYGPAYIFETCNARFLPIEISDFPNADMNFLNINHPEDYILAKAYFNNYNRP